MAFVWLWARPDFPHFYLDLLVTSHVTTIFLAMLFLEMEGREITLENTLTSLLATHCIKERITQAVTISGREHRFPDVWGYILSTGTDSSSIWKIHERGRLRKTEEPLFLLSYSTGSQAEATNRKAARWLPPTAPRWSSYLWKSSWTAAACRLTVKGKPELVACYWIYTFPKHLGNDNWVIASIAIAKSSVPLHNFSFLDSVADGRR